MTLSRGQLILALVACDRTFSPASGHGWGPKGPVWVGKCIHCRSALVVGAAGEVTRQVTIEHIVPKAAGGADVPSNLALACARCNHQKGSRLDARGLGDERLARLISTLQRERTRRLRHAPEGIGLTEAAHAWLAGLGSSAV